MMQPEGPAQWAGHPGVKKAIEHLKGLALPGFGYQTQGLMHAKQVLYHFFALVIFQMGSHTFPPELETASLVAGIAGVHHHTQLHFIFNGSSNAC
jgi:hypothetical protein